MPEPIIRRKVVDTFFIHNCFGSFFSGVLNWFADDFYPRFEYKVIGTYDKAVEFFKKRKELGEDPTHNVLPSITLDPMYDFSNEERGGRFLWQHSRYAPGLGLRMWSGIDLKEQDIIVTPVFSRYQGTFEVLFWLSSVYELFDFRVALLQYCGGFNRWLRPEFFWTYLILPDEIANYNKDDNVNLDWSNTYSEIIHVDTINKHRLGVPFALDGMWKLDSFGDQSTKYGGDTVAEYKLAATFTYEINMPTYVVLSDKVDPRLNLTISLGNSYTKYPLVSPFKILQAISDDDKEEKYISRYYNVYQISNALEARDNLIVEFSSNSLKYPNKLEKWNHIATGTLIRVDQNFLDSDVNKVHKHHIIYIDQYQKNFLPSIRRAAAVICRYGTKTDTIFSKCEILKKPVVINISDVEAAQVEAYLDQEVTFDSYNMKLYSGVLDVSLSDEASPAAAFKAIEDIKDDSLEVYETAVEKLNNKDRQTRLPEHMATERVDRMKKRLLKDKCDGIQTKFYLDYVIDDDSVKSLLVYIDDDKMHYDDHYIIENNNVIIFAEPPPRGSYVYIGGEFLIIKESKLVGIYEFTQDDIDNLENDLVIDLPQKLDTSENLVVVSYMGRLEYEKHYTLDIENQIITLALEPVIDEIVEFFYYV